MAATVREVIVRQSVHLSRYRVVDGLGGALERLERLGREVGHALGRQRVWMLNSTEAGGGVAEMLPRLCALLRDVGVDARWLVLDPEPREFFQVTKALHNMLHGEPGGVDMAEARQVYEEVSRSAAGCLRRFVSSDDVLVVHDPQPAGAAAFLRPEQRPVCVWRCHVGLPYRNESTHAAWDFLRPYLAPYRRLLFSAQSYIPDEHMDRSTIAYPGIDPLSHKNRELRPYKLAGILRSSGLLEGPEVPPWARFKAQAQVFDGEKWGTSPIPGLLFGPTILQVSRFDRLKGFQVLLPAFELLLKTLPERVDHLRADTGRVLSELGRAQLVLAGPDPAGVADDPEGAEVLDHLCALHRALPREVAARVHLVRLPMVDVKQNALMVNALQRVASLVLQNSLKEGFGLTVSEALWKGVPVVAANVGGIGLQVRHNTDGHLVDDPHDPASVADEMLQSLAYPKEAEAMACSGRQRVRELFLVTSQVLRWLEVLGEAATAPRRDAAVPMLHA